MPKVEIIKQKGYHFLWIDDYLWMWDMPVEQRVQKKLADQACGEVLVAGYGLGLVQKYLIDNPKVTKVVTVEMYPEVIQAARDIYREIYGDVLIGDFYKFAPSNKLSNKFDFVIGDVCEDIEEEALAEYNNFKNHARKFIKPEGKILAWGQEFFETLNSKSTTPHLFAYSPQK